MIGAYVKRTISNGIVWLGGKLEETKVKTNCSRIRTDRNVYDRPPIFEGTGVRTADGWCHGTES